VDSQATEWVNFDSDSSVACLLSSTRLDQQGVNLRDSALRGKHNELRQWRRHYDCMGVSRSSRIGVSEPDYDTWDCVSAECERLNDVLIQNFPHHLRPREAPGGRPHQ
jgi:hypothetical protein